MTVRLLNGEVYHYKILNMALLNTSENKFIAKPNNRNEQIKADYVFLKIFAHTKTQALVEAEFFTIEKSKPQGMIPEGEEFIPEDIKVSVGTYSLGICDTNIESSSFALDCHNFAQSVLGEQFAITELNNV